MHPLLTHACEYAILKSATAAACVSLADGVTEIDKQTLDGALRREIVDGACLELAPIADVLDGLEPRDLRDVGVHAELRRLAHPVHVDNVVHACQLLLICHEFERAVDVATLVFDGVDVSTLPNTLVELEELLAAPQPLEVEAEAAQQPNALHAAEEMTFPLCSELPQKPAPMQRIAMQLCESL